MIRFSHLERRFIALTAVGFFLIGTATSCSPSTSQSTAAMESSYSQLETAGQLAALSDAVAIVRITTPEGLAHSTPTDGDPKISERGYGFAYFAISAIRFLPDDTISPATVGAATSIAFPVINETSAINLEADMLFWSTDKIPVGSEILVMLSSRDHGDPKGSLIVTGFGRIDNGSVRFSSIPPGPLGDKELKLDEISTEIVKGLEFGGALRSQTMDSWGSGPPSIPLDGSIKLS